MFVGCGSGLHLINGHGGLLGKRTLCCAHPINSDAITGTRRVEANRLHDDIARYAGISRRDERAYTFVFINATPRALKIKLQNVLCSPDSVLSIALHKSIGSRNLNQLFVIIPRRIRWSCSSITSLLLLFLEG